MNKIKKGNEARANENDSHLANNGNIMECALLPLTFAKQLCKIGTMKMINKTQITTWALRAYMVYSITADLILLGGIVWLILN